MVKRADISELKLKIVERILPFDPEQIILFGSYAYGNPTEDSDLDICVVEKKIVSRFEEKRAIRAALKDLHIAKDIFVEESAFLQEHSSDQWINTAWHDIVHKGEILYEKK